MAEMTWSAAAATLEEAGAAGVLREVDCPAKTPGGLFVNTVHKLFYLVGQYRKKRPSDEVIKVYC